MINKQSSLRALGKHTIYNEVCLENSSNYEKIPGNSISTLCTKCRKYEVFFQVANYSLNMCFIFSVPAIPQVIAHMKTTGNSTEMLDSQFPLKILIQMFSEETCIFASKPGISDAGGRQTLPRDC